LVIKRWKKLSKIIDCMENLRNQKRLTREQCRIVAAFVDKFTTCSLSNPQVADKVREVQIHKHTHTNLSQERKQL
jgi:hypothetical protein